MEEEPERPPLVFSDKNYNILKWLTGIVLPSIGTLYFGLAAIWGLPAAEQVLGSLIALQAFLGTALGLSSHGYNKSDARFDGAINVIETDEKTIYSLDLKDDPEVLNEKKEAVFKVNTPK